MRQLVLPDSWDGGGSCVVEGGRARYISRVLRLVPGDRLPAMDSGGRAWSCVVREAGRDRILLGVSRPEAASPEGASAEAEAVEPGEGARTIPPRIVLVQGIPKGAKMDLVFRQAAEAGVYAVVPLASARSVARAEEGGANRR